MEKSKIQLAIEKATNILKFFTEKSVEASEKFESVKIVDSDQLVEYSELVVGADVSVSSSDGSTPAKDGNFKLVNGAEIEVKDGKISEIVKKADTVVEDAPADEAVKMASDDVIKIDYLTIGSTLKIENSEGERVAEDGTYSMTIEVKDGQVSQISTVKANEVAPTEGDVTMAEDAPVGEPASKTPDLIELEDKVSKLEEAVKAILEAVSLQPSAEEVKEFNSKIEKLSKLPTQASIDSRVEIQDSEIEKFTRLAEKYTK